MADSGCCDIMDSSDDEVVNTRPRADPNKPAPGKAKTETAKAETEPVANGEKLSNGTATTTSTETNTASGADTPASETAAEDMRKLYLEIAHKKITEELARLGGKIPGEIPPLAMLPPPPPPGVSTKRPTASPSSAPAKSEEKPEETAPPRVRASKLEFRRLDELYDKGTNSFYLAETHTTSSSKEDEWEEFVFIVKRRFDWQNRYQKTVVDIKSKELHNVMRNHVLKGIQGISLVEEKPSINPDLLFNYQPQFEEHLEKLKSLPEEEQDKRTIQHLELLLDYLDEDYTDTSARLFPLLEQGEITFDLLWGLYLPNTLLFAFCPGSNEPRCVKLDWAEYRQTPDRGKFFHLDTHMIDYDGKTFSKQKICLEVGDFRGARRIDDLNVFPMAYHERESEIRDELITRGKQFCKLEGMHYKMYKGIAFYRAKKGVVKVNVDGRVMVDAATFKHINPNYRAVQMRSHTRYTINGEPKDTHADPNSIDSDEDSDDEIFEQQLTTTINPTNDNQSDSKVGTEDKKEKRKRPRRGYVVEDGKIKLIGGALARPKSKKSSRDKGGLNPENMTEEELLLCSPTVLGFSFADKLWVELAVSKIADIEWTPDAFESLVLPVEQKSIVMALVESHTSPESAVAFDDVVKGKGKGLVAVLHGRPGVGKTLTAEGISEYLRRPLYMVSVGELGTDARSLEQQLSKILEVAHIWGAVLLLDEADVFLERRSVHDIQRNALVSIFLRLLEYFQGILFLTTNRVETFDEAFQSRIHIAIRYNDLDQKAKRQIWKTFLSLVEKEVSQKAEKKETEKGESEKGEGKKEEKKEGEKKDQDAWLKIITKNELEWLSKRNLNGRQIKNAVRTAHSLATNHKEKLSIKHLKTVLAVTEGFENDLKGTGQLDSMMSYA